MKILHTIQKILSTLKICSAAMTLASLPACASNPWTKQVDSGLPIEAIHSGTGTIMSLRAHETFGRLYVAGRAKPHQLMQPMHVDIQLIGADGSVIAERTDELDAPQHPRIGSRSHGHQSYLASFLLSEARKAVKIRVVYHGEDHSGGSS
jgi:hypothetical protein